MTFSFVFFLGIHKCTFFFYLSHFDELFMNIFFLSIVIHSLFLFLIWPSEAFRFSWLHSPKLPFVHYSCRPPADYLPRYFRVSTDT